MTTKKQKNPPLYVVLSPSLRAALDRQVVMERRTLAAVVTQALEQYLTTSQKPVVR